MRSTFKLLFYVKRNAPKNDNSLPLMGRITVNKGIVQFSLKMTVPPELWDSKAGKAMGKSEKAKDINRQLEQIRVTINNRYQEIVHLLPLLRHFLPVPKHQHKVFPDYLF